MSTTTLEKPRYTVKEPANLSPRIRWLRDYYFQGVQRRWNNEFTAWSTGTPWDFQFEERGDIIWRYKRNQVGWLRAEGYLKI